MKKTFLVLFFWTLFVQTFAANWYVNTGAGGTNSGTLANPWTSLASLNWGSINPGDSILFARGQYYSGTVTVNDSSVVFGAYGTGANPIFIGTGATINQLFNTNNKNNLTFINLTIRDTGISISNLATVARIRRGFYGGGARIKVLYCTMDRLGIGAGFTGNNCQISYCDISNMRMIVNDIPNPDNDYGANPVVIESSFNTITYNYFHDCWAESYDYQYDGGCVELFNSNADNNFIAYNRFENAFTITETGANDGLGGTISNNVFAYNKCINNGYIVYINNGGTFAVNTQGLQFFNNVFVETTVGPLASPHMIAARLTPTLTGTVVFRNNIVWLTSGIDLLQMGRFNDNTFIHSSNVYYYTSGSVLNFTPGTSERVANPLFVSTSGNPFTWDYHLQASSPAIDLGATVTGLSVDFGGTPIKFPPEAGIYEYEAAIPGNPVRTYIIRGPYSKFILKPAN